MMKFIVLLVALLAATQCADIFEENGFNLIGVYNISNDCNVYQCPNTPISSGTEFVCPQSGTGNGQITYSGGYYSLELRTASRFSSGGYIQQYFTQQNLVGNAQVQIPLYNGYTLNMMPCFNGQSTSYLCPADPYYNDKVMVGWKSYQGQPVNGCNFLMMHQ